MPALPMRSSSEECFDDQKALVAGETTDSTPRQRLVRDVMDSGAPVADIASSRCFAMKSDDRLAWDFHHRLRLLAPAAVLMIGFTYVTAKVLTGSQPSSTEQKAAEQDTTFLGAIPEDQVVRQLKSDEVKCKIRWIVNPNGQEDGSLKMDDKCMSVLHPEKQLSKGVDLVDCTEADQFFVGTSPEGGHIRPVKHPEFCLDSPGPDVKTFQLQFWPCKRVPSEDNINFLFSPHSQLRPADGRIALKARPDRCINVPGPSKDMHNGQPLQLWNCRDWAWQGNIDHFICMDENDEINCKWGDWGEWETSNCPKTSDDVPYKIVSSFEVAIRESKSATANQVGEKKEPGTLVKGTMGEDGWFELKDGTGYIQKKMEGEMVLMKDCSETKLTRHRMVARQRKDGGVDCQFLGLGTDIDFGECSTCNR